MLSSRGRRRLLVALGALAAAYALALAAARSAPATRWLRGRIAGALLARAPDLRLGDALSVDPLFRVHVGPIELPSPGGDPPRVRVREAVVRASFPALLVGRLVPVATLRDVTVALPFHGARLEAGPLDVHLRVDPSPERPRLDASAALPGGGELRLAAQRTDEGWHAAAVADRIRAAALPAALRTPAAAVTGGVFSARLAAEAPVDLARATGRLRVEVDDAVVAGAVVAADPVGPLDASATCRLEWDRGTGRLAILDGEASLLGAVPLAFAGELALRGAAEAPGEAASATFTLAVKADRVEWSDALAALPPALAPPPEAPRPAGPVSARLEVSGPLLEPHAWAVAAVLDLAALREAGRRAGGPLAAPFRHRPLLDGGRAAERVVGPASPDFVPIAELPEFVLRAVTAAEDAGFFAHSGFDFDELRNAAVQGAEKGRLVRGGSTITQQLAKNLFLDGERTFARKVREAAIAVGLEATLPKRRLLEIYLNVAEWGPGVWGIGPAARHWFGKDARALSPKEAAFLASIIPSPVRSAAMRARGAPTDAAEARAREILFRMAEQGALPEAALFEVLAEPVRFVGPDPAAAGSAE
jgi:hypothetical protein